MEAQSIDGEAENIQLTDLPDGVLARIFCFLDAPALSSAEWVCKRFRTLVMEDEVWRDICCKDSAECARLSVELDHQHEMPWKRSALYYSLHTQLTAPWEAHSLLAEAKAASTTDNIEESASNVLTTLHRFNPMLGIRTRAYWSSKGSRDEQSAEWLLLSLVHPLCLVRSVAIRPFRATFQRGHPLYSSKAVRFTFSCGVTPHTWLTQPVVQWDDLWAKEGKLRLQGWVKACETSSETFPMQQKDELQEFTFREPILCVGGLLKIEFLGRMQKQEQDDAWYTCINYVSVSGKPLYGFVPTPGPGTGHDSSRTLWLKQVKDDPLVASGGLMKMSEGGLLQERLAVEEQGGSITDSDDEADAVDAEGVPLFMWQALGDLGAPVAPPEPQPFDGA